MSASTSQRPANNFDLLRLIAASAVIFAHGFVLYGYDIYSEDSLLAQLPDFVKNTWHFLQINAGNLGVYTFFLISGYLISGSIIKDSSQLAYWQKRLLRIMPGLVVCVVLTAFVMGPLVTTLPLGEYLSHGMTYGYLWNISIYQAATALSYHLPGVFDANPSQEINGSLWTLRYEVTCYIMVAFFSLLGFIRRKWVMLGAMLLIMVLFVFFRHVPPPKKLEYGLIYTDLVFTKLIYYTGFFQAGIVYKLFEKDIKLKSWHAWVVLVFIFISNVSGIPALIAFQFLAYAALIFTLSQVPISDKWRYPLGRNDYSYGIYIYGMPIQQLVVLVVGTGLNVYVYILLCLLAVLPMAMFSWHFVEKPMLSFKPKVA